jgi:hypothetical protein
MTIAALVSSAVPAIFFAALGIILEPNNGWAGIAAVVAFVFSFAHVVVFGIPITLVLNRFNLLNWLTILAAGFVFAFSSTMLLSILSSPSGVNSSAEDNGEWTVINGVTTAAGWRNRTLGEAQAGILGLVVSGVFFGVLKKKK